MRRNLHIGVCAVAIVSSAASLYELFALGATRWTTAFNVLSIVLILMAVKTRPVRQP